MMQQQVYLGRFICNDGYVNLKYQLLEDSYFTEYHTSVSLNVQTNSSQIWLFTMCMVADRIRLL